jgi:hypothetical protein
MVMIRIGLVGLLLVACTLLDTPAPGPLPVGTWGGKDAGMIVSDSGAHLHVGCTLGEVALPITVDEHGRFNVPESHNLTAFPIDAGIFLPARLTGRVEHLALSFTLTIDDTVHQTTVVLGPVRLQWGVRPEMGPCPICTAPADRTRGGTPAAR